MDKDEWLTWRLKNYDEDYRRKKYGPPKERLSPAEYNHRVYHLGIADKDDYEVY